MTNTSGSGAVNLLTIPKRGIYEVNVINKGTVEGTVYFGGASSAYLPAQGSRTFSNVIVLDDNGLTLTVARIGSTDIAAGTVFADAMNRVG